MRHLMILLAAASMPLAAAPALASEVQIAVSGPVVELQVTETVLGDPDKATVGAGVTTRAPTAVEAMKRNAQAMTGVIDRLRKLGIDRKFIQTSGVSLNPQYEYRNNDTPRFLGYDVTNQVTVELRDVDRVGPVLDTLVAAGANNLNGPKFGLVDPEPARAQARRTAFDRARQQAQDYARMAGFAGVRLLAVEEAMHSQAPMPMGNEIVVTAMAKRDVSTPVEPGQVGTAVSVTAKFEMTR